MSIDLSNRSSNGATEHSSGLASEKASIGSKTSSLEIESLREVKKMNEIHDDTKSGELKKLSKSTTVQD